jgi:ribosomal protein S24E|tara:strand:+ start:434 stop:805 length:372 start_codon:yes stop_codon:yes gene_type:complete
MEITDRKENPILNRVELTWQWRHTGAATPTRNEIIDAVVKMEPGATKDRVLVKSVSTRFGQPLTTGNAFVYGDRADLEKEPKYILARHGSKEEAAPATEAADEEPAEDTADDAEAAEIAGGEE